MQYQFAARRWHLGAKNNLLAYLLWAGKVPPQSMVILGYMATISRDQDERPWYGEGHKALAEHALGRRPPLTRKDIGAVERAVTSLLEIKAIEADRRPAPRQNGHRTVRYVLNLDAFRIRDGPVDNPTRPTESVG